MAAVRNYRKSGDLTETYCVTIPKARVPSQGVRRAVLLLKLPGQNVPSHLPASRSSRQSLPRGCVALISVSVLAWPSPLPVCLASCLVRHLSWDLRTSHMTQDDLIPRSLMTSAKTPSLKKFTFTGSRGYDISILFFLGGMECV